MVRTWEASPPFLDSLGRLQCLPLRVSCDLAPQQLLWAEPHFLVSHSRPCLGWLQVSATSPVNTQAAARPRCLHVPLGAPASEPSGLCSLCPSPSWPAQPGYQGKEPFCLRPSSGSLPLVGLSCNPVPPPLALFLVCRALPGVGIELTIGPSKN